jgi:membrane protein implicated in regulation of membrane protease activity
MDGISITYIWLTAAVLLMLIEALGAPGTGLMFAGLGALTTGMFLYTGMMPVDDFAAQYVTFFLASALWAAMLWKPLQEFRRGKKGAQTGYSNIIGDLAYVGSTGITRTDGEVTWSGTIMKARLAQDAGTDYLEAGTTVIIVSVAGATLTVKPQS